MKFKPIISNGGYVVFLLIFLTGCRQDEIVVSDGIQEKLELYVGSYQGEGYKYVITVTDYEEWDTLTNFETVVTNDELWLKIFDHKVHLDSLMEDEIYSVGDFKNWFSVRFVGDSLYYRNVYGGLGSSTSWDYRLKKIQ